MSLLIIGVIEWSLVHWIKRLAPGFRQKMSDRMGEASKGVIALLLVLSIVLMVLGYRAAPYIELWQLPRWAIHLNNLAMLGAVFLFGMSSTTGRLRGRMRHPMLTAVIVWALAHLMVNGDVASLVLFGGMGAWAAISIILINRAGPWQRPTPGPARKDIILVVATVVMFIIFSAVHAMIGPSPFG